MVLYWDEAKRGAAWRGPERILNAHIPPARTDMHKG